MYSDFPDTPKVVITGGAGVLGSAIAEILSKAGWSVFVYDVVQWDSAHRLHDLEIQYLWKSVHDLVPSDIDDVDVICHCAAQPDRPLGISSPYTTMWMNIMGLQRLLEVSRRIEKLKKFVFPSSGTPFAGVSHDLLPCNEYTVPKPTNPYAASKYMGEVLVETYHRCYGVPSIIIRSGLVYGPNMRLDMSIAQFIKQAMKGEMVYVRSPNATRTPTFIDDVMQYWKTIICDKKPEDVVGETFHAVYGKEYSVIEMAEEVCRATGMGLPVTSPIYEFGERVENEPVRSWMVSLKDNLLGVKPQFDLHNGLMRTIPDIYFRTRDNGTKQTISDDIKHNTGKTPVQ